jgi:hypothetical protein
MREMTHIVYFVVMGTVIFLVLSIFVTLVSGFLYALLKLCFGKRPVTATESEPGQIQKKAKKSTPAVVAPDVTAVTSYARVEPTFGDAQVVALVQPLLAEAEADDTDVTVEEPDASVLERDAAFADRMADQFAAQPVSA